MPSGPEVQGPSRAASPSSRRRGLGERRSRDRDLDRLRLVRRRLASRLRRPPEEPPVSESLVSEESDESDESDKSEEEELPPLLVVVVVSLISESESESVGACCTAASAVKG